jgi:mannose-6-phosphate isomerase-like protein (cupin superfamily)
MRIIEKPWGFEKIHYVGKYVVKELFIKKGHRLSLQYHKVKTETLVLMSGIARVVAGEDSEVMVAGYVKHIEPGTVHRIEAWEDAVFIECSTPELEDVVRLEDDYGR